LKLATFQVSLSRPWGARQTAQTPFGNVNRETRINILDVDSNVRAKGMTMLSKKAGSCLLVAATAAVLSTSGCTVHAGYYDPYYHDYHPVQGEVVYYGQWERETHREHRELKQRNKEEQKEYWDWRHKHDDRR